MSMLENNYSTENGSIKSVQSILKNFKSRRIMIDGESLTTTPAFDAYWYFASARQDIFHARVSGKEVAKVQFDDRILRDYRFTNAYRASDRVSQYLISDVIGNNERSWSNEDTFFRIMLFKIFNKIETWTSLEEEFGQISVAEFKFSSYDNFLSERQKQGVTNYSAAYIMPSAGNVFKHKKKHSNHLALIQWMLDKKFPDRLKQFATMEDAYSLMLTAPSLGPFLAFQFVTDINYSSLTNFSEMEFVVAGPGAHDGISKCFQGSDKVSAESIISYMAYNQTKYFTEFGHQFNDLWGRSLQLIDCQNIFCEVSKYTRVAFPEINGISGRTRIKQKYSQSRDVIAKPVYPVKWGINKIIENSIVGKKTIHQEVQDYHNQDSLFH